MPDIIRPISPKITGNTAVNRMLLSILVPTLKSRKSSFTYPSRKLRGQVSINNLDNDVEIPYLEDEKDYTVGYKRNQLPAQASGRYVAFVDDDDDVCENYIPLICDALRNHPGLYRIGIKGEIRFRNKKTRLFVHSLHYRSYFVKNGVYYRPPYHLNPIFRALLFLFLRFWPV